jgi:hypothetical protein
LLFVLADAWNALGNMSKEDAIARYLEELNKVNPNWEKKSKL